MQSRALITLGQLVVAIIVITVSIIGILWSLAIRPILNDIESLKHEIINLQIQNTREEELITDIRLRISNVDLLTKEFFDKGSPAIRERLSVLEKSIHNR